MGKVKAIIKYLGFKIQKCFYNFKYKNKFKCEGLLFNCQITIVGNNEVHIAEGCVLNNVKIFISGTKNSVSIGKNVKFHENGIIRIEDENNKLSIGNNTTISGAFFSMADNNTQIAIGDNCLLSADIIIRTSDGHSILNINGDRINPGKDVQIGNHVWIGYGVNILKGSVVGDNSIIGTKALVCGSTIAPNSLVVGSPAKVVKTDVDWCHNRI